MKRESVASQWKTTWIGAICLASVGAACGGTTERPDGWGELTHSNDAEPDYLTVFDETVVHRFDIEVSSSDYEATMEDLAQLLSGGGPGAASTEDPMYVPVTVRYNDLTWWHVGMRYKGNSSLRSAWQQGIRKLAFRFNFDKFEDDYPEIDNQRFYGFEKMTFSNGFKDPSLIRDKVGADIFRAGGVPAAFGAFARVYVDFGEGSTYFGLYTMIEDPSDAMLDAQFTDGSGNLYKPEANWTSFIEADFEKKTNEDAADFSDVQNVIVDLNATAADPASWRTGLEEHFDTDAFLRNLAINQVMVNWDSYGCMAHNYYVYADPSDAGRLVWFPWDLNESMLSGGMRECHPESVMLDEIGSRWPLIRKLLDDAEYRQLYEDELAQALDGAFEEGALTVLMEQYHDLIDPHVTGAVDEERAPYTFLPSSSSFATSLRGGPDALIDHVGARQTTVRSILGL